MRNNRPFRLLIASAVLSLLTTQATIADELTTIIQVDLVKLGYEPGDTTGELTLATVIAISKFQAENDLEVTGEPTPQLAGILSARVDNPETGSVAAAADPGTGAAPESAEEAVVEEAIDPETLRLAQEACIQEKIEEAQAKNKKQQGFNSLMSAVSRTAGQVGSDDVAAATGDIYSASATAADLSSAAKDLGVTEDDLEECKNPL